MRIELGTFQYGFTTTWRILSEKMGVWFFSVPTTTRVVYSSTPSRWMARRYSGMLTITLKAPRSRGIQRQRSILAIMSARVTGTPPLRAASVAGPMTPSTSSCWLVWKVFIASTSASS
ncbi:hypothetical protein D9M68_1004140 [compost metagenome]